MFWDGKEDRISKVLIEILKIRFLTIVKFQGLNPPEDQTFVGPEHGCFSKNWQPIGLSSEYT